MGKPLRVAVPSDRGVRTSAWVRCGQAGERGRVSRADRGRVGPGPPYPTSLDLYAELRAVTPPSLHSLLTDLFETMTL
ncbi:MAG TPA: hypothetical protein VF432_00450 [Thermoanaerobaculia bacterium]